MKKQERMNAIHAHPTYNTKVDLLQQDARQIQSPINRKTPSKAKKGSGTRLPPAQSTVCEQSPG